jgi:hypothetical protein
MFNVTLKSVKLPMFWEYFSASSRLDSLEVKLLKLICYRFILACRTVLENEKIWFERWERPIWIRLTGPSV